VKRNVLLVLLGAAVLTALVVVLVRGRGTTSARARAGADADANLVDAGVSRYSEDAWLDSCLGSCRAGATRRLAHLSPEKQRQYCDVNCRCGLEKMTEPGPKPGQVKAPSLAWLRLSDEQQMQAARDCQQRSNRAVGGAQPPGAP